MHDYLYRVNDYFLAAKYLSLSCVFCCVAQFFFYGPAMQLLPSLKQNQGERLLRSVVSKWKSYKRMTTWLSDMFHCLNNYNISEKTLEKLREMSYTCFLEMVCPISL